MIPIEEESSDDTIDLTEGFNLPPSSFEESIPTMGHYFEIDFPSPQRLEEISPQQKGKRKRDEASEMASVAREETRERPLPQKILGLNFHAHSLGKGGA